ncbi:hypothetical protein DV737_g4875, partial [Chaetothyriales sp. CBS 132003]
MRALAPDTPYYSLTCPRSVFFLEQEFAGYRVQFDGPGTSALIAQDLSPHSHARGALTHISPAESQEHSAGPPHKGAEALKHTDPSAYSPGFESDEEGSWALFSRNFNSFIDGLATVQWTGLGDKIADFVVPSWARYLPDGIQKLNTELSMEPGSLADDIWQEAHDPAINPEILWDTTVRVGTSLPQAELDFRERRRRHIVKPFAKYLDIPEKDINMDDIPTIAMCGSGGGLRALVAGTSSYYSAQQAGLLDCVTYSAGVSGSCWLQTLFYSTIGKQDYQALLKHLKARLGTHIAFPPTALKLATSAPTNKFILSGFVEKLKGDPDAGFGLVDVYGMLLGFRLLVPHGDLDVHAEDLKLSNQRAYIDQGQNPMPIYTAVRHEIPLDEVAKKVTASKERLKESLIERAVKESWFQWIEMSPFEVGSEEFGAWIPTWSLGRPFYAGRSKLLDTGVALPEIRQSLLLGIWGSAFTATLAHYYKEVRPVLSGLSGFAGLDELIEEKNDDMAKIHPIDPATIPNWAFGMKEQLPASAPQSIFKADHLQLMDAGMSNNLPIYPLLRPDRDVDILIAFDASADIKQENWLSVVDGYAKQRGIKTWPVGTGWPKALPKGQKTVEALDEAQADSAEQASQKLAAAQAADAEKAKTAEDSQPHPGARAEIDLGPCNIWVGTKEERETDQEPPASKRIDWEKPDDSTFHLTQPNASIVVIYFPLLPNKKVPGVDPDKTDFMSTWNFIYTPEQIDKVVELAKTNFEEGSDATKQTIRAVYERKKRLREGRDKKGALQLLKERLQEPYDALHGI